MIVLNSCAKLERDKGLKTEENANSHAVFQRMPTVATGAGHRWLCFARHVASRVPCRFRQTVFLLFMWINWSVSLRLSGLWKFRGCRLSVWSGTCSSKCWERRTVSCYLLTGWHPPHPGPCLWVWQLLVITGHHVCVSLSQCVCAWIAILHNLHRPRPYYY